MTNLSYSVNLMIFEIVKKGNFMPSIGIKRASVSELLSYGYIS